MTLRVTHSRCIRFITLLIPLFMVFVGMRVPDFSRPHKPKPMRRAILDNKSARSIEQSIVKIAVDPFITTPLNLVFLSSDKFVPEALPKHLSVSLLLLSLLPSRAPPLVSPFA